MPSDTPSETVCGNEGCGNEDYAREDYARGLSLGAPFPTNDLASWSMVRPLLSWTHLRGWQRAETWRRAAPRQVAPWAVGQEEPSHWAVHETASIEHRTYLSAIAAEAKRGDVNRGC